MASELIDKIKYWRSIVLKSSMISAILPAIIVLAVYYMAQYDGLYFSPILILYGAMIIVAVFGTSFAIAIAIIMLFEETLRNRESVFSIPSIVKIALSAGLIFLLLRKVPLVPLIMISNIILIIYLAKKKSANIKE